MASFMERAMGAARLDVATYEEVEHDPGALGQAMTVVVVASVANGIGSAAAAGGSGPGLVTGIIASLIGWFVWAGLTYLVGTKVLPTEKTQADLGQLLRTTGFSAAPGTLGILGIVPVIGGLALLVASLWQLAAMVVAVRQALDYDTTGRAIGVCLIGFLAYVLIGVVLVGSIVGAAVAVGGGATPQGTMP
jgi:hypothetical protein